MHTFGIADEEFIRGKVPMTKAEIRAMVMVKAAVAPGDVVADIGAGTGSLSVEAALASQTGAVYAVERNPEGISLIEQNAEKFGCSNIIPVHGSAPEAMKALPLCQVILIGGTGGRLGDILDEADAHLAPQGRIVLTAVTAETTGEVVAAFARRPYVLEGFQMQVNRLRKLGHYHLYTPLSPVFIFTAQRKADSRERKAEEA